MVVAPLLYTQLDDEIRVRVERQLARHYPDFATHVGSAELREGQGIVIRDLQLVPRGARGTPPLLEIDELLLVCPAGLPQLIREEAQVERVVIRRATLRAERSADGSWNLQGLLPPVDCGMKPPPVVVQQSRLEIADARHPQAPPLVLHDIALEMTPAEGNEGVAPHLAFSGSLATQWSERVEIGGTLEPQRGRWQLAGRAARLQFDPAQLAALPLELPPQLAALGGLRAEGSAAFRCLHDPGAGEPRFAVELQIDDGRLEDPRLPLPLSHLNGRIHLRNDLLQVDGLRARSGATRFEFSAQQAGLAAGLPIELHVAATSLPLERSLVEALPPRLAAAWPLFLPAGTVDVDLALAFDGQQWRPDGVVRCRDVAFSYHKFPYRLQHAHGDVRIEGDRMQYELVAQAQQRPVTLRGEMSNPGPHSVGWFEAAAEGLMVDPPFVAALPAKAREVARQMQPRGAFDVAWRAERETADTPYHKRVTLAVRGAAIRFEKFPYPIEEIEGTLEMVDDRWTFRDLTGSNGAGVVTCQGTLVPATEGSLLQLEFAGGGIALDEELRRALSPTAQKTWSDLKPRGRVDLSAHVRYASADRQLGLQMRVEPQGETTSIEPVAFPYRIEGLQGVATYDNGDVRLQNLRGRHAETRLTARGASRVLPDGSWQLSLEQLTADHLKADRDLLLALPAPLRRALGQLDPRGPIHLRGTIGVVRPAGEEAPLDANWNLELIMQQGRLRCGVELTNVNGAVRLQGQSRGSHFRSRGELDLDSLTYQELQFSEVRGPLWLDNGRVLLGNWAEKQQGATVPRHLTARLSGGAIEADGWVALDGEVPRFSLTADLRDGDLERLARENLPGRQRMRGRVVGQLELHGTGRGVHTLGGSGEVRVRDAEIYELPLLVALLKVLRVRAVDSTAFTETDVQFRIDGRHVYFDQFDFVGDAVSLYGRGEMNFDHELNLAFHSVVGRNDLPIPLLRKFVGQASEQLMQVLVRGTLANPDIRSEALPGVTQALLQLQHDLQSPGTRPTRSPGPPPRMASGSRGR